LFPNTFFKLIHQSYAREEEEVLGKYNGKKVVMMSAMVIECIVKINKN
jgi:hypothetical protein